MKTVRPLRDAWRLPMILVEHRELLGAFVRRELRARIEGSALGRIWPVLQPALLFVIYFLIFSRILKIGFSDKLAPHGPDGVSWRTTFYLVTGILPWTALAECLGRGTGVVLENANLIKKIAFPSELLPIYQVVVYHVYFLIGFVILLGLQVAVNGGLPGTLVWFPLVLFVQMLFVAALTLFFSAANVFIRDIMQAVPIGLTFWMFTTPVFYDLEKIHEQVVASNNLEDIANTQFAIDLMRFNPMATLLDLYRAIFSWGRVPFPADRLATLCGVSLVLLYLAYAFFLRSKGRFADEV